MNENQLGFNTLCTHAGEIRDEQFQGAISPLYMSTSYNYEGVDQKRYPRYFNTPNQEALAQKIAALEKGEAALIFGSGMAAISTTLYSFLSQGDHCVVQGNIYGGTRNLVTKDLERFGISYTLTPHCTLTDFENALRPDTKVIYLETPSNPLLSIVDIESVVALAKRNNCITIIDNTFASPVNQNPIPMGVDIVLHSATKYLGGHSDISAGAVITSQALLDVIFQKAINFGGNLSDFTVWLLERSIKTLGIRVQQQNKNALAMAEWLVSLDEVKSVYYPGLSSHPEHDLARKQMKGFGGMLSFELTDEFETSVFMDSLQFIKKSMSLAGVESTILAPTQTSHSLLTAEERKQQGISDQLIRFSVGIEDVQDLQEDIRMALKQQTISTSLTT